MQAVARCVSILTPYTISMTINSMPLRMIIKMRARPYAVSNFDYARDRVGLFHYKICKIHDYHLRVEIMHVVRKKLSELICNFIYAILFYTNICIPLLSLISLLPLLLFLFVLLYHCIYIIILLVIILMLCCVY